MSQTFVPAYTLAVEIDSDTVIGLTASSYDMQYGPTTNLKRLFGSKDVKGVKGTSSGTVSLAGSLTVENISKLVALRDASANPDGNAITVTMGAGGSDAFKAIFRVGWSGAEDGEVDWTLDGDIVSEPVYTAPT